MSNILTRIFIDPPKRLIMHILHNTIPPVWVLEQQLQAVNDVHEAKQELRHVREQSKTVNSLVQEHVEDWRRNSYSERVAWAMKGKR